MLHRLHDSSNLTRTLVQGVIGRLPWTPFAESDEHGAGQDGPLSEPLPGKNRSSMDLLHRIRALIMPTLIAMLAGSWALTILVAQAFLLASIPMTLIVVMAIFDRYQTTHGVMRNYPVLGRLRYLFESAGPELRQYFVESNTSGRPFDRDQRDLMYRRSKGIDGVKPFGTEHDVYADGYGFISHSSHPAKVPDDPARTLRVKIGGSQCSQPYSSSILNVSAMSFGALSARAILSIGGGAKLGGFALNTGEGGLSRHHRETGADLIWQIGTGYYGCRREDGHFDADRFEETARQKQVRMIEIKVSQGAKPGHGGMLPAPKVSLEIAEARDVPVGQDCVSPAAHTAFSTPIGLLEFIATLRERSGGKPVGIKLCVGHPRDVFALTKAMLETGIRPDFITVDGAEGGTGAAPTEFSDHLGFPLLEGLRVVRNALVGTGLKDEIRIAASGKRIAGFEIAQASALGADWCNLARGFMFAIGCIQSQSCHTNGCPVGIATQDPNLQRAIVVEKKAQRAYLFHRNTIIDVAAFAAACGLEHPFEFRPHHIYERVSPFQVRRIDELFEFAEPGQILDGNIPQEMRRDWAAARADFF